MLGIGIGTMALVIVLSVFNGLEDLNRQIFKSFDPDIKISAIEGKTFELNSIDMVSLSSINGIAHVGQVIQDNALARYQNAQMIVNLKGVDTYFEKNSPLKKALVDGQFILSKDSVDYAIIGGNVYEALSISLDNIIEPLDLWYPKSTKKIALLPEENINTSLINISGVFALEQNYDDFVYVPLAFAEQLTDNLGERTSLEIYLKDEAEMILVQNEIKKMLGGKFKVQNRDEQNANLFRAIKIEKLFIFIALLFIIGIASFNVFFSLTMLVIDKEPEIKTLSAFGANASLIRKIFFTEGAIISFSGAGIGLFLGWGICYMQQKYGLLKMGIPNAIVDAYPVKMQLSDFVFTAFALILITILASLVPAKRATENIY